MKIETKYDLGQTVFVVNKAGRHYRAEQWIISSVQIDSEGCWYWLLDLNWNLKRLEVDLFPSRAEAEAEVKKRNA